jgi:hypothetical protein
MRLAGAEANFEPRIYNSIFDITESNCIQTAVSCTGNKILSNKINERGQRATATECRTTQRSYCPLRVERTSL